MQIITSYAIREKLPARARGEKEADYKITGVRKFRSRLYSLFVDNISKHKYASWLRSIFSKEGRVMNVFIPSRWRVPTNTKFGFIRFKSLAEAKKKKNQNLMHFSQGKEG